MSSQLAVHLSADASFVPVPDQAPASFHLADPGEGLPPFFSRLEELADSLGVPRLSQFLCGEEAYDEAADLEMDLEDAEEEEDEAEIKRLKKEISSLVPHHPAAQILAVVRPLIHHLEANPTFFDSAGEDPGDAPILGADRAVAEGPNGMTSTQTVLYDLVALEFILADLEAEAQSVFLLLA